MEIIFWQNATHEQQLQALARPQFKGNDALEETVSAIVRDVKARGDVALREYGAKFDKIDIKDFRVYAKDIKTSVSSLDPSLCTAMMQAKKNITAFHELERPHSVQTETMLGVTCALHWRAIETVGIYIPAGTAPLFSTVLMAAIPAHIAGCRRVILCSPPQRDGSIHPAILAAADLCHITEIYTVGGAQAIAAMAYGTDTLPKVDKICGPGNAYVTMAKKLVMQDPDGASIDMPAGPSDVIVIAEATARPDWVAADMLAQAEHDVTAQAMLITTDADFGERVKREVQKQMARLSRRSIAEKSMEASRIIVVPDMPTALAVSNQYAPEHLILHNEDAEKWLPEIRHAGSVFLGAWSPESAGDYASGTNHVLPTYGYARAMGGLTVLSFMKSMTVQSLTREGLQRLAPTIITMAEAEGLTAHAQAVQIRTEIK